jgi:hypothetical protein
VPALRLMHAAGFKVLFTQNQGDTKRLFVLITTHLKAIFKRIPEGGNRACRNKDPLPTFKQWKQLCSDNTRVTVREMWGRVLCSIPRAAHFLFPCTTVDAIS